MHPPMNPTPFPDPPATDATPMLKRKVVWHELLPGLVGAAVGAALVYSAVHLVRALGGIELNQHFDLNLWTLLLLPAIWLAVVLAHEFGHLLGGRLGGMRPLMLFAGPLHFTFDADGRTRLQRNRVKQSFNGLAACAPRTDTGRGAFALMAAGGPLASFVFSALLLPPAFALGGWWGGLLFATGLLSLLVGVLTLMPLRAGGFMSDGGQLLGIARDDDETRQRIALSSLMAQSYAGVRPRDWDPGLFAAATAEAKEPTLREYVALLRAGVAEEHGQFDEADAHWRGVAARLGVADAAAIAPAMRGALALSIAAWLAHRRRDPAAARRWLAAAQGGFNDPAVVAFVEAAIAWREGDAATARHKLDASRSLMPRMTDRGGAIGMAESIDDIARDLDTTRTDAIALAAQA
jgi:hypothetical protein